MLNVLNHNGSLEDVNSTFTNLIPKIKNATKVGDFKPISLYNVIYKIGVKILANRLKTILSSFISPNQSAFILGRLIIDNIIIDYEIFHSIINKCKGNNKFMALKLDMSKTYDQIE